MFQSVEQIWLKKKVQKIFEGKAYDVESLCLLKYSEFFRKKKKEVKSYHLFR